jgi:uncharacterized membrane-anchored protein
MTDKNRKIAVIVVVCLQMIFFAVWYAAESDVFEKPEKQIMVKTVSYDPRDLLRGQYIRLNYSFSNASGRWDRDLNRRVHPDWANEVNDSKNYSRKKKEVWVVLHEEDGFYEPKTAYYEQPNKLNAGEVVIRGVMKYRNIRFGIERYFVPEGTKEPRSSDTTVQLNLYEDGRVRINKVFVKGEEWP